eukprot:363755-Chlamydomonas_euryale.AAC.3
MESAHCRLDARRGALTNKGREEEGGCEGGVVALTVSAPHGAVSHARHASVVVQQDRRRAHVAEKEEEKEVCTHPDQSDQLQVRSL